MFAWEKSCNLPNRLAGHPYSLSIIPGPLLPSQQDAMLGIGCMGQICFPLCSLCQKQPPPEIEFYYPQSSCCQEEEACESKPRPLSSVCWLLGSPAQPRSRGCAVVVGVTSPSET